MMEVETEQGEEDGRFIYDALAELHCATVHVN